MRWYRCWTFAVVLVAYAALPGYAVAAAGSDTKHRAPWDDTVASWDHLHLATSDTKAASEWYQRHIGGELTKVGQFDSVILNERVIKFKKRPDDSGGSVGTAVAHIAFAVQDPEVTAEQMESDGATRGSDTRYTVKLDDPWGIRIELVPGRPQKHPVLHHIRLVSPDPEATLKWYQDVFGGRPHNTFPRPTGKSGKNPNFTGGLLYGDVWVYVYKSDAKREPMADRGVEHLGWSFTDFRKAVDKLKAMDTKFLMEPRWGGEVVNAFIEGPDGVKIEIFQGNH